MANTYSITEADITPGRIADHHWRALMVEAPHGGPAPTLDDIAEIAVSEVHSHCGGAIVAPAAIAVARPHVLAVVVYRIHAHRASRGGYTIPEPVVEDYKAALEWAKTRGREIVVASGAAVVGATSVRHVAPTPNHDMEHLDRL